MKHVLTLMSAVLFATAAAAQSTASADLNVGLLKNATDKSDKFYFPASLFADSLALRRSLPQLSQQVAAVYKDTSKSTFFENMFLFQSLTQDYKNAIIQLDSLEKQENAYKPLNILYKSYAQAKAKDLTQPGAFKQAYTDAFKPLFGALSFNDKTRVASMISPATMTYFSTSYQQGAEKLKSKQVDSLSLDEAQKFLGDYSSYNVLKQIAPLTTSLIPEEVKEKRPVVKSGDWVGVVPVQDIDEVPNPALQYKLLMELTSGIKNKKDSAGIHGVNIGVSEVARLLNLHVAAGIPRKNITVVVVVHGPALRALYTNDVYKKKYGTDNPNRALLKELQEAGVKIIACGQAMNFMSVNRDELIPDVKLSLTAQTVLSSYQLQQYVYYDLSVHDE